MFQIIQQIEILDKDNASKEKKKSIFFSKSVFIIKGGKNPDLHGPVKILRSQKFRNEWETK